MVLYHGSDVKIIEISLKKGKLRTDFGQGFYLADKLDVAKKWAFHTAGKTGIPVVTQYRLDNAIFTNKLLKYKRFDSATEEWLHNDSVLQG